MINVTILSWRAICFVTVIIHQDTNTHLIQSQMCIKMCLSKMRHWEYYMVQFYNQVMVKLYLHILYIVL